MSNVQLPGSNRFDSQMQVHTGNQKNDVSLAKEFQHNMTKDNLQKWCHLSGRVQKKIHGKKMYRQTV